MDHLYIRHAVGGKLFYDSKRQAGGFSMSLQDGCWVFTLNEIDTEAADALLQYREELNLFLIDDTQLNRKAWFYSSQGLVEVDSVAQLVRIRADVRHDYTIT